MIVGDHGAGDGLSFGRGHGGRDGEGTHMVEQNPHGTDIMLDPHNANTGTVRGRGMVERSLSQYGAGRSILISADDIALAGNKTLETARELGIPVKVIESDGTTLYAIKRTDLPYDDPRARELAIADNRAAEVGLEWSAEVLTALQDEGLDIEQFWFPDELADVLTATSEIEAPESFASYDEDIETEHECPKCGYQWSGKSS